MKKTQDSPARHLEEFLNYIDEVRRIYDLAVSNMAQEERRRTDIEHEIEFSSSYQERCRAATKLQHCQLERRKNKDLAKRYELIVQFFQSEQNAKVLNQLRQLLGRQRREEEWLDSERVYKKRA